MSALVAVCSAKPKPSVHKGSKGGQWWARDVYHIARNGILTLCGRDRSDWLTIGPISLDDNCCKRCRKLAKDRP